MSRARFSLAMLQEEIKQVPRSWIPTLLRLIVVIALDSRALAPSELHRIVSDEVQRSREPVIRYGEAGTK